MLAFELGVGGALDLPDRLPGRGIELDDLPGARLVVELHRAMDQLKIEGTVVEDRRRGHPKLDIDPSEALVDVGRPHLVAIDGVAGEDAGAEEAPDMFPVGRRGRGGGVALAGPGVLVAAPDALLPEDLPILHRETEDDEVVSLVAREEDPFVPDAGGGAGPAGERGSPAKVLPLLGPVGWQAGRGRRAVVVWPAPIGPVLGRHRLDDKRHQRGDDGGREGAGHGRGSRGCLAGVK